MANVRQFPLTYQQTLDAFELYKQDHGTGKDYRASHADFFRCAGVSIDEVKRFVSEPNKHNLQTAALLKNIDTWIKAEYDIDPRWNGPGTGKAIFLHKQDFGFGSAYVDKVEQQQSGKMALEINFGGAKDAFK